MRSSMLHSKHSIMTLTAQLQTSAFLVISLCLLGAGCGNDSARAPNPTSYRWPDEFAYRLDYVSDDTFALIARGVDD